MNPARTISANVAVASNAVYLLNTGRRVHFLRALGPFGPESLSTYPNRLTTNRNNAYIQPRGYARLAKGLLNFDTRQCSSGLTATLDPNTPNEPAFNQRTEGDVQKATDLYARLRHFAFADQDSSTAIPAPGCNPQGPFAPIYGKGAATTYQHTFAQGE